MSDFNYQDYLRNNPLFEQLESDEDFGTGGEEVESLAADVVMGRISYKDAREKASKSAFSMKELNNAIAYVEDITGKSAPNYSIGEDYDPDAEQDDEDVPNPVDDEGRPLGEVQGWGRSDQFALVSSMHRELGKPSKFPSLSDLIDAAESATDFYMDDFESYEDDKEGLVMMNARSYARQFFPEMFDAMKKFAEPLDEGMHTKDPRQIEAEREIRDQAKVFYLQKLRRGEIDTLPEDPFQAYMDMLTQDQIDHDEETLRRELGENKLSEEDTTASYEERAKAILPVAQKYSSLKDKTGEIYRALRDAGDLDDFDVRLRNSKEYNKLYDEAYKFLYDELQPVTYFEFKDHYTYHLTSIEELIKKGELSIQNIIKALKKDDARFKRNITRSINRQKTGKSALNTDSFAQGDYIEENKMNKMNERLNVARDALTKVYKELGATTFSKMILNLRDENVLDELANEMGNQYRGVMQEARDYRMTYPSYKVEEFNAIGDMAHNGILNLMSFAEQHKPEVVGKIKAVAEEVMNLIYDDMEEFDTQPRIRVKETIREQVEEMVKGAVKVFQKEGGALGIKALEDGLNIDTKKAKALLKTMIKRDLVFLHRDGDYILKEGHGLTADDIKVIEKTIDKSSDAKLTDILKFIVSSNIKQAKRADLSKGK